MKEGFTLVLHTTSPPGAGSPRITEGKFSRKMNQREKGKDWGRPREKAYQDICAGGKFRRTVSKKKKSKTG